MLKTATIDEAQAISRQYGVTILSDQFFAILRLRGYEVTDLESKKVQRTPGNASCNDCHTSIPESNATQPACCPLRVLCSEDTYICSSCGKPFCAEHVLQIGKGYQCFGCLDNLF